MLATAWTTKRRLTAMWRDAGAVAVIEQWLASVEVQAKEVAVCAYLAEPRRR